MQTFLAIVGAIALGIVALLIVGIFWIRRKFLHAMQAAIVPTPLTISVLPEREPEWLDASRARRSAKAFLAAGFTDLGVFQVPEMCGALLHCFHRDADCLTGVITEVDGAELWEEIGFAYGDDSAVFVCNSPNAQHLDSRPGKRQIYLADAGLEKLLLTAESLEATGDDRQAVDADSIAGVLEDAYAEDMRWRLRRGGTSLAEIRRLSGPDTDEETIREAWRMQRAITLEQYQTAVLETWAQDRALPKSHLENLPRLPLVVPEYITRDELIELLAIDWDLSLAQEQALEKYGEARHAFGLLFDRYFEEAFSRDELLRVDRVDEPLPATIYADPSFAIAPPAAAASTANLRRFAAEAAATQAEI